MKTNQPTRKGRILSVSVVTREDCNPDFSYLGDWSNEPGPTDRTIDRGEGAGRGCYRYFIAANSAEETGNPDSVRQDYERAEAYARGDWYYTGIIAQAEITLPGSDVIQRIRSGGIWGVESDAGDYLKEVERDELNALRVELEAVGFGKRAIDAAFNNVSNVSK